MTRTQRFLTAAVAGIALATAAVLADDGQMVFKLKRKWTTERLLMKAFI